MTFSVGTIYRLTESGATLGFGLLNFGTSAQFTGGDLAIQYDADPDIYGDNRSLPGEQSTDSFPVPVMFRLGLSVPFETSEDSRFLFLVEALHPNDNSESAESGLRMGVDAGCSACRAGYQTLFQTDCPAGLDLGLRRQGRSGEQQLPVGLRLGGPRVPAGHAPVVHGHRFLGDIGINLRMET